MKQKKLASALAAGAMILSFTGTAFADSMMISNNLTIGSRGSDVVALQTFLAGKSFLMMPAGVSMGYFGPITKAAVMRYQTSVGIMSTGFFGPLTRAKINSDIAMMPGSMNSGSESGVMVGGALMVASKDIVDNAVNANNVTTVVAAIKAAGLVDTLKGAGPFTVFAPTNSAFEKLPAGTVSTLLKPENKAQLTDILTYHVVAGRYTSNDLYDGQTLTTVEGKKITIKKQGSQIWINGSAMVETADVISRNGVTFVIDTVLMPM